MRFLIRNEVFDEVLLGVAGYKVSAAESPLVGIWEPYEWPKSNTWREAVALLPSCKVRETRCPIIELSGSFSSN